MKMCTLFLFCLISFFFHLVLPLRSYRRFLLVSQKTNKIQFTLIFKFQNVYTPQLLMHCVSFWSISECFFYLFQDTACLHSHPSVCRWPQSLMLERIQRLFKSRWSQLISAVCLTHVWSICVCMCWAHSSALSALVTFSRGHCCIIIVCLSLALWAVITSNVLLGLRTSSWASRVCVCVCVCVWRGEIVSGSLWDTGPPSVQKHNLSALTSTHQRCTVLCL